MQRLLEVAERWEKQEKLKKKLKKGDVTEEEVSTKLRRLDKKRRKLDKHHREILQSEARRHLGPQAARALMDDDGAEDLDNVDDDEEDGAGDSSYDSEDSFLEKDSDSDDDSDDEDYSDDDGAKDDGARERPRDAMTARTKAPK